MNRKETTEHTQSEANTPKASLIELLRKLEEAGAALPAQRLSNIIGQLEHWQNTNYYK